MIYTANQFSVILHVLGQINITKQSLNSLILTASLGSSFIWVLIDSSFWLCMVALVGTAIGIGRLVGRGGGDSQ